MAGYRFMSTTEHLQLLLDELGVFATVNPDKQGKMVVLDQEGDVKLDWVLRLARTALTLHREQNPHATVLEAEEAMRYQLHAQQERDRAQAAARLPTTER